MKKILTNPYFLSVFSAILCVLSFPPYNFSFLIWFALVPFLYAIIITPYEEKKKLGISYYQAPLIGGVFGIVFYFGTLNWIFSVFGLFGLLLLMILCVYPILFAYGLNYVHSRLKSHFIILLFPSILWTTIEFIKSEGWWLKFSWMNIGYSQHNFLPILQFSSILGQYGLTALILLINSFILYLYFNRKNVKEIILVSSVMILIVISIFSFGLYKMNQQYSPEINVALVQDESSEFGNYKKLIDQLKTDVDFILLPEYALPIYLDEDSTLLDEIKMITNNHSSYFIVGSKDKSEDGGKFGYYNTAYLFNPSGEIFGKYYKMNPIQFFNDGDPGKEYSVFSTQYGKIGILICYDMDYSYVARNIVRNGAEVLFIPTYDALRWSELQHQQHSAMTSIRAVENGRFIARTATSGISQIIEPNGKISKMIPIGASDITIGNIMPINKNTFYTNYGFTFVYLTIIVTLVILLIAFFRKFNIPHQNS